MVNQVKDVSCAWSNQEVMRREETTHNQVVDVMTVEDFLMGVCTANELN